MTADTRLGAAYGRLDREGDRGGPEGERRGGKWVVEASARGWHRGAAPASRAGSHAQADRGAARQIAGPVGTGGGVLRLRRRGVDDQARRRGDPSHLRRALPSGPCLTPAAA